MITFEEKIYFIVVVDSKFDTNLGYFILNLYLSCCHFSIMELSNIPE